jgi:hypothetical protein
MTRNPENLANLRIKKHNILTLKSLNAEISALKRKLTIAEKKLANFDDLISDKNHTSKKPTTEE